MSGAGLSFRPHFATCGARAEDLVTWSRRTVRITDPERGVVFEQRDIEAPADWSDTAVAITASRYFARRTDERSVRELVDRVLGQLLRWGREGGCFTDEASTEAWAEDLRYLLLTQRMSFNSPVWFNIGLPGIPPQAAACVINSVADSTRSTLDLARAEEEIFRLGSGSGTNLSSLPAASGRTHGAAVGPLAYMLAYDAIVAARLVEARRRPAKMFVLDVDHPDIIDFVDCKANEERKAWALIDAGWTPREAYDSVRFQHANHSVRVTDNFMRAVEADGPWQDGRACDLWECIARAAWACGDPGLQYDGAIQSWNTVPHSGRINASNPCAEHLFLDDTACNLLTLNLLRFLGNDGELDVAAFRAAIAVGFTAQEILVSNAHYPSPAIAANTEGLRPLGLGFANLGALLMAMGLAYDSEEARRRAAGITALMTADAYAQSARMAAVLGPFAEFARNREAMLAVITRHRNAGRELARNTATAEAAAPAWELALELGREHGYRNAQATVIPPAGTVALMMDCDTTGIEPCLALVTRRSLDAGGELRIVNRAVPLALRRLGYGERQVAEVVSHLDRWETLAGARTWPSETCPSSTAPSPRPGPPGSSPQEVTWRWWPRSSRSCPARSRRP